MRQSRVSHLAGRSWGIWLLLLVASLPINAQAPLSLNNWVAEDYPDAPGTSVPSDWIVGGQGQFVEQRANSTPSVFYSDLDAAGTALRTTVTGPGDDDFFGFAFGFQPGDTMNPAADYLLIDWKKTSQSANWCGESLLAAQGLAVSRVVGIPEEGEFWSHINIDECSDPANGLEELQRGLTLGSTGWSGGRDYVFEFVFTTSSLQVFVDGGLELDIVGDFTDGRFGFYDFVLPGVVFRVPATATLQAGASGLYVETFICRNVTTGQEIMVNAPGGPQPDLKRFNCEHRGLIVSEGDDVEIVVQGFRE